MAKFRGPIGFLIEDVETSPGVWEPKIEVHVYTGEFIRRQSYNQSTNQVNDGLRLSDDISIVLDPFAINNYSSIKYVEYMGTKWRVDSVEIKYPRLILSVGGVWNEQTN